MSGADLRRAERVTTRGFQGYSAAEMAATSALAQKERPGWRWLFPVTRATRDFVKEQIPVLQGSYALAVGLIYWAAHIDGVVSQPLMRWWLLESVASIALRSLLYIPVVRASPVEVASQPALRLAPLLAVMLGAGHWVWTATIFVRSSLDLTTLVVFLAFVMLSIACIALAPASPATCVVYLLSLWLAMAYKLSHADGAGISTFAVLLAALASILWMTFHTVVGGVRRYLLRSDEADLLVLKLRQRNAEVEGLRSAAARELVTRSAFFASASHDLRQRVHAMKLVAHSAPGVAAKHGVPGGSLTRVAGLVDDLESYMTDVLEFARLETTGASPAWQRFGLQRLFQQLEVEFEDVAAAKRVEFRARATRLMVHSDAAMLLRILENLVANAIKFTNGRVLLVARRRADGVVIDIRDQGPGIRPEHCELVFEAFFQGFNESRDARQGVGLGLAIVKRLAAALGYPIEVHSWPGRGTLMRLVIPDGKQGGPMQGEGSR